MLCPQHCERVCVPPHWASCKPASPGWGPLKGDSLDQPHRPRHLEKSSQLICSRSLSRNLRERENILGLICCLCGVTLVQQVVPESVSRRDCVQIIGRLWTEGSWTTSACWIWMFPQGGLSVSHLYKALSICDCVTQDGVSIRCEQTQLNTLKDGSVLDLIVKRRILHNTVDNN